MTRDDIISKAEALFMAKGIRGTSIGDIAESVGISKGTLFYHFRSKDDLVFEIASAHVDSVSREVLALAANGKEGTDVRTLVSCFLAKIIADSFRNNLHVYLVEESLARNGKLKETLRIKYAEWARLMTDALTPYLGKRAGSFSLLVIAVADGLVIGSSIGAAVPDIDDIVKNLLWQIS